MTIKKQMSGLLSPVLAPRYWLLELLESSVEQCQGLSFAALTSLWWALELPVDRSQAAFVLAA